MKVYTSNINLLWNVAPILNTNLIKNGEITFALNARVKDAAIHLYDKFLDTRRNSGAGSSGKLTAASQKSGNNIRKRRKRNTNTLTGSFGRAETPSEIYNIDSKTGLTTNDHFFEFQRNGGFCEQIMQTPEIWQLQNVIGQTVQNYLSSLDTIAADEIASRLIHDATVKIDMWATVQIGESAYHADHVHENVFVSGVYYASIPEGSAPLVFHKPEQKEENGAHDIHINHDADDNIIIHPEIGQIVIFPPWLLHGVPPSTGLRNKSDPRISFAFNVSGASLGQPWDVTNITEIGNQ